MLRRAEALEINIDDLRYFEYDTDTDITCVGILLWELLLGFHGTPVHPRDFSRAQATLVRPIVERPEIGKNLSEILLRCVANDPDKRFPDAAALLEALDTLDGTQEDVGAKELA